MQSCHDGTEVTVRATRPRHLMAQGLGSARGAQPFFASGVHQLLPRQKHKWVSSKAANPLVVAPVRVVRPTSAQITPRRYFSAVRARSAGLALTTATAAELATLTVLAILFPLSAPLRELLHVGVELLLVLRRERGTDLGPFAIHQRLDLVATCLVAIPHCSRRGGVTLLASGLRLLHRRPQRLAKRLALRRVLAMDLLDLRLLGIAQLDPTEKTPLPASTLHPASHAIAAGLIAIRGSLCSSERRGGHERCDDECNYTNLTHAASKVLARDIARLT